MIVKRLPFVNGFFGFLFWTFVSLFDFHELLHQYLHHKGAKSGEASCLTLITGKDLHGDPDWLRDLAQRSC